MSIKRLCIILSIISFFSFVCEFHLLLLKDIEQPTQWKFVHFIRTTFTHFLPLLQKDKEKLKTTCDSVLALDAIIYQKTNIKTFTASYKANNRYMLGVEQIHSKQLNQIQDKYKLIKLSKYTCKLLVIGRAISIYVV